MYISVRNLPAGSRTLGRVPRTVVVLGFVSLLTDISTEMVTAVLPLFVTVGLGLSPIAFGVLDSVYQAGTALARIVGGYTADRLRRPKAVATAGYSLGMISKLLLLPVAGLGGLSAAIGVDRIGKGLRTGPRDALIAASTPSDRLGLSFGVHRALDTLGALLGPLLAFYLLLLVPGDFDAVFLVSVCVAGLGVLLLVTKVPGSPSVVTPAEPKLNLKAAVRLVVRGSELRRLLTASALLAALTISDAFLYLILLERGVVTMKLFPLLFLLTSIVYLAAAIPVGRLADRYGRTRLFVIGHLMVVAAYVLAATIHGLPGAAVTLALLGLYYAATDGVLPAAAATLVPTEWRSTAISTLQTGVAVGRSLAALAFGALWAATSPSTALWCFIGGLTAVLLFVSPRLLRHHEEVRP